MLKATTQDKIILFILIGVFFGLCINSASATMVDSQNKNNSGQEKDSSSSAIITRPRVEYDAQNFRDPFAGGLLEEQPSDEENKAEIIQQPPPSLRVQGVIWGTSLPQAIVNNKVVKVGDSIEGAVVTGINKAGISINFADKQYDYASSAKEIASIKKEAAGIK